MRHLLFLFIIFSSIKISAQNTFTINGSISNIKTGEIWLTYNYLDDLVRDTAKIINGKYHFKGKINRPIKATLDLKDGKDDYLNFILEPAIQNISGEGYPLEKWKVSGGECNASLPKYEAACKNVNEQFEVVGKLIESAVKDSNRLAFDSLFEIKDGLFAKQNEVKKQFIIDNKNDLLSIFLLEQLYNNNRDEFRSLKPIYTQLSPAIKKSVIGKSLGNYLFEFDNPKNFKSVKNIAQKDTAGKIISLSSLKGKYVLIDFWASWCMPCRALNPDYVSLFSKYKSDNFTIYSISLDDNAKYWKKAIVKDNMHWLNVSELKGWENSAAKFYKINQIPQNILVDPSGSIIDKNLPMQLLREKLNGLFKH